MNFPALPSSPKTIAQIACPQGFNRSVRKVSRYWKPMESSPAPAPSLAPSTRPRGEPTVTPGRFGRFFTPRSASMASESSRSLFSDRPSLRDITSSPIAQNSPVAVEDEDMASKVRSNLGHDESCTCPCCLALTKNLKRKLETVETFRPRTDPTTSFGPTQPILRSRIRERLGGSLRRELDWASHWSNRSTDDYRPRFERREGLDTYYTCDKDLNYMESMKGDHFVEGRDRHRVSAFCSAACYSNPVVAVGDDDGNIRLLDSSSRHFDGFDQEVVAFHAHRNTVLDLAFSFDDLQLATVGGDNICRIWDVKTQQDIYALPGHTDSVKRILWQPGSVGNYKVLATLGRDYTIKIWDTRVSGLEVHSFAEDSMFVDAQKSPGARTSKIDAINTMANLHTIHIRPKGARPGAKAPLRQLEDQITCMTFLPNSPHMIVTGAARQSAISMWDIRRTGDRSTPVARVQVPKTSDPSRGTVALAVNTNGTRLFALDRSSCVKAFSTQHFFQGAAPELRFEKSSRTFSAAEPIEPVWQYKTTEVGGMPSFFTRLACRPATTEQTELLAMGSNLNGPIVMNTDERMFANRRPKEWRGRLKSDDIWDLKGDYRDDLYGPDRLGKFSIDLEENDEDDKDCQYCDDMIITSQFSQYLHGHGKDVSSVSWTSEGNLVSCGDDMTVRVWRTTKYRQKNTDEECFKEDSEEELDHEPMTACQLQESGRNFDTISFW